MTPLERTSRPTAAQVRIQQLRAAEALEDCRAALRLDPAHQKTLSRMARASEVTTHRVDRPRVCDSAQQHSVNVNP